MSKFMYGASVQGIQGFIFETNKLKEIVGASEIVEEICTKLLKDFYKGSDDNIILSAAGNIKIIADSKNDFKKLVREFPKAVAELAPGITISQAVVECNDEKQGIQPLEEALKQQRNKQMRPTEISALGIERSRRTGKSAVENVKIKKDKREIVDNATKKKIDASKKNSLIKKLDANPGSFSNDMKELTSKDSSWLAVIHADGNSLGKVIQNLGKVSIKEFSKKLNKVTEESAKCAFDKVISNSTFYDKYPFRPIVIGGDDLTVICRADLALDFIGSYLKAFQENGKEFNLTASAGIAFVKESYPFHYAIDLAEELCGVSKAKSREKASVSFHKVQSSFMDSYSEIKKRELTAKGIDLSNGPYFLDDLDKLQYMVKVVSEKDAPKSGIRKWLSELHNNKDSASQLMDRIIEITKQNHKNKEYISKLKLEQPFQKYKEKDADEEKEKTHLYDLLSIASLKGGE